MIKAIILTCGYVEEQSLGFIPFVSTTGFFKTKEIALKCLADTFLAIHKERFYPEYKKPCCISYIENKKFIYCPECRTKLQDREGPGWDGLALHILTICNGKLVQSELTALEEFGWTTCITFYELHKLKKSEIVTIEESAEKVLAKLALDIKDEEE